MIWTEERVGKREGVRVTRRGNGIVELQRIAEMPVAPKSTILPLYDVREHYVIDTITGKTFDATSMYPEGVRAVTCPGSGDAYFASTKEGNFLVLNRVSDNPLMKILEAMKKTNYLEISDQFLVSAHESGHGQQFSKEHPKLRWNEMEALSLIVVMGVTLSSFAFSYAPGIGEWLSKIKTNYVDLERNAHAFSLAVARRLRDLGVDVYRGYSNEDLIRTVDFALRSYDGVFMWIKGLPASQALRRTYRQGGGVLRQAVSRRV